MEAQNPNGVPARTRGKTGEGQDRWMSGSATAAAAGFRSRRSAASERAGGGGVEDQGVARRRLLRRPGASRVSVVSAGG